MKGIPKELRIHSFKDFCIRYEELYDYFWEEYAPERDITEYREYLLSEVSLASSSIKQEYLAGLIWEYLMGDIDIDYLFHIYHSCKLKG